MTALDPAGGGGPARGGPVAVLVGPPGAGKSTIGALLAGALGRSFADTDTIIEATVGKPIPEIFIDDGEPHFRKLEAEAVATALESFDGVLALGAGAILADQTRALLRGHPVVYLRVDFSDAMKRVGLGGGRPLLKINPRATMRHLLEQRRPLYEEVARYTVDTTGGTPDEVVRSIVESLSADE
jgi:shikimate kinase